MKIAMMLTICQNIIKFRLLHGQIYPEFQDSKFLINLFKFGWQCKITFKTA